MVNISVNKADLSRIFAAIDRVGVTVTKLAALIAEESAREFADILRTNITTQKYGDFGEKRTSNWKKGQQNEEKYWFWLGTVLKSVKAWNIHSSSQLISWFVGLQYTGGVSAGGVSRRIVRSIKGVKGQRASTVSTSVKGPTFTRIDPSTYVPQTRQRGTILGRGEPVSFGFQAPRKRVFNTEND